jgi:transcriptional regulator with XRE-family HTH domain
MTETNIYILIGTRIKQERVRKGLSQSKLAAKVNTSTNYIWNIEKGLKKASLQTLKRIADTLEVPLNDLFKEVQFTYKRDTLETQILSNLKNKPTAFKEKILKIIKILD